MTGPASSGRNAPPHYRALQSTQRPLSRQCSTRRMFEMVESVASQLSCCLNGSALADPLSESTLLAVGPCGWLMARAIASVAF